MKKKVVLLGDSEVGKTALVRRLVDDDFSETYKPTAAAKPYRKRLMIGDRYMELVIWDIPGHTLSLHPAFYSGAQGGVLVCDLKRKSSADSLSQWHNALLGKVGIVPTIVLANKSDLEMTYDLNYIKQYGYDALEVSAKDGQGVKEAFMALAELLA